MLFASQVYAACSSYNGFVTLNEVGKVGFVEIKLLNSSIPASVYQTWTTKICDGHTGTCTGDLSFSGATLENSSYLRVFTSFIPNNKVFDVILKDGNGDTIDYLSVDYLVQQDASCTPVYDWTDSVSNSHDYRRVPDGTGNWGNAGNGNSGGNTGGGTNDGSGPTISVTNITVDKGTTATFTFSISSSIGSDITFDYTTQDSSALAGTHYTATSGTATISAGSTSTTVDIATIAGSPGGTVFFYLNLSNPVNGVLGNNFPTATLLDVVVSATQVDISHDGSALTCLAENITFTMLDAMGATVTDYTGTITLSTSTGNGDWELVTGAGILTKGASDSGAATYTFDATDNGVVILSLSNLNIESLDIDATDGTASDDDSEGNLTFHEAGFILTISDRNSCTSDTFTIEAVQIDTVTNSCKAAYFGTQNVEFTYSYVLPNSSAGSIPEINGTTLNSTPSTPTSISVDFGSAVGTGIATLPLQYDDAGQISITASDPGGNGLSSGTATFFVTPAQLIITSASVCAEPDLADCDPFKKAGEGFDLTVTATCSDGTTVTPNFETVSSQISLSITTVDPILGNPVSLDINNFDFSAADDGIHLVEDQTISEVGVFTITATNSAHSNSAETEFSTATLPTGTSDNIGRITPAYFIFNGLTASNSCGSFTYGGYLDGTVGLNRDGQSFTIDGQIQAHNVAGNITRNYTDDFLKFTESDITASGIDDASSNPIITLNYDTSLLSSTFSDNGDGTFDFDNPDVHFQFESKLSPIDLITRISVTDSDGVTVDTNYDTLVIEQRLGRLILQDSYGPEISDLEMRLKSEYFDGADWITNTDDNCSIYDDSFVSFGTYTLPLAAGDTAVQATSSPTLSSGVSIISNGLWFDAPGAGNYGSVEVILDMSTQPWLQYDWDEDDIDIDATLGILNFGYYRGSDRVIYWQEQ